MKHGRIILLALIVVLGMAAWVAAADGTVDQKGVLAGKVLAEGLVAPGASVREGDVLVYVESIAGPAPAVRATCDGKVAETLVKPGDSVRTGDVLIRIQPARK
ncbi:MAG: acetyl-CoA carboxylase biotin carboxyl carrier protein subunit [Negativicutes bacterium]|nr:acetyl-CoA carboxylase biotin carboxyl carrier protein subunit [Negativicutes bacterium]